MKNIFIKAYTYDRIVKHLLSAKKSESRKREIARINLALKLIAKWYKEEEKKYGTRNI